MVHRRFPIHDAEPVVLPSPQHFENELVGSPVRHDIDHVVVREPITIALLYESTLSIPPEHEGVCAAEKELDCARRLVVHDLEEHVRAAGAREPETVREAEAILGKMDTFSRGKALPHGIS
jgi:hypothetical protein